MIRSLYPLLIIHLNETLAGNLAYVPDLERRLARLAGQRLMFQCGSPRLLESPQLLQQRKKRSWFAVYVQASWKDTFVVDLNTIH